MAFTAHDVLRSHYIVTSVNPTGSQKPNTSNLVHPELWRVSKGGSNDFGIVIRFALSSLTSAPLLVRHMFAPAAFQHVKPLKAYHNYLDCASSSQPGAFDENAAGRILSLVYLQSIGLGLIALNLVYTKAPEGKSDRFTGENGLYLTVEILPQL